MLQGDGEHLEAGYYTLRELDGVYRRQDPTAFPCMRYPGQKALQAIKSIIHRSIADSSQVKFQDII